MTANSVDTMEKLNIDVKGDTVNIRRGNLPDLPKIFQYEGFSHQTTSAQGFIDLVKAKANKPNCVVFWQRNGHVNAIMDDTVYERPQDTVTYKPAWTIQYAEWKEILTRGVSFDHKSFIDFLRTRQPYELQGRDELLFKVRKFTYATRTDGEAIRDDNNNYSYALKVNNVETTVQMPASVFLEIELFEESNFPQTTELDLEIIIPRKEGEKLTFRLSCPTFTRYESEAMQKIIDSIREGLDGYLVVKG